MSEPSPTAHDQEADIEVSVVMPCLNEEDTVGICVRKARQALEAMGARGEIIVADNGSRDASAAIALQEGARVVPVPVPGYGAALQGGIRAARGRFIIMGDADDSYDFLELEKFVTRLRAGAELVMGCRLPRGGGTVLPGAMPGLHRWWGNPMFSAMVRAMYGATIHDVYCGMRGFSRDLYERLAPRCTGMEFATEMVMKAGLFKARVEEVPITLHPDGRQRHAPHLRTFRDGWRTLRLFMLFSPKWLFLVPGLLMMLLGAVAWGLALPNVNLGGVVLDAHTLLFGTLFIVVGYQSIMFGIFAKMFAISEGLLPAEPWLVRLLKLIPLERCLLLALAGLVTGAVLLLQAVAHWRAAGFGALDYSRTMRWVIPGFTLAVLGFQTLLSSFFISVLGLKHR